MTCSRIQNRRSQVLTGYGDSEAQGFPISLPDLPKLFSLYGASALLQEQRPEVGGSLCQTKLLCVLTSPGCPLGHPYNYPLVLYLGLVSWDDLVTVLFSLFGPRNLLLHFNDERAEE